MTEPLDMQQGQRRPIASWFPAAAALGLVGTVVLAAVVLGGNSSDGSGAIDPTEGMNSLLAATVPSTSVAAPIVTETVAVKTVLERVLTQGVSGSDVEMLQQRLTSLGFVPGPADGVYGEQTVKAVWAYEKLVLGEDPNAPSGQVTPAMWEALQDPFVVEPRRPDATPNHTEVYLPEQVLAIFHDDVPVMITHMSSGSNEEWCEEVTISPGEYGNRDGEEPLVRGECGISNTPGGVYSVYREVEGVRQSALGGMWNPVYFNYGIAIHGALNVPLQGASHGCIRIPLNISESMQQLIGNGDQVFVWDGILEPEENGSPPPTFNWLDPEWASTTTTTQPPPPSTTTVSTTQPPVTIAVTTPPTIKPAATTPPTTGSTPPPATTTTPTTPTTTTTPTAVATTTTTLTTLAP